MIIYDDALIVDCMLLTSQTREHLKRFYKKKEDHLNRIVACDYIRRCLNCGLHANITVLAILRRCVALYYPFVISIAYVAKILGLAYIV